MQLKALGHYVLVKPDNYEDEVTESGLLIQRGKIEKEGTDTGIIVDIGPNAWKAFDDGKPWAKVGDRILFGRYAGYRIKDKETDLSYFVMNDDDVKILIQEEV